jgi:hemerythrin HHE cation binding domain-containing protein
VAKHTERRAGSRKPAATRRKQTGRHGKPAAGSRKRTAARRKPAQPAAKISRSRNAARAAASRTTRKGAAAAAKPSAAKKAAATVKGALAGAVVAFTKRLPGGAVDAITLLETDHRHLEDLLKRGEETSERAVKARKALLDTIARELTIHETIEERLLYPALKEYPEARGIVLEGFQEHHVVDLIMKELYETSVSDEEWGAKFKVFKENIEHHIKEEEGPMFRTARGVMSRDELIALGRQMAEMKDAAQNGTI